MTLEGDKLLLSILRIQHQAERLEADRLNKLARGLETQAAIRAVIEVNHWAGNNLSPEVATELFTEIREGRPENVLRLVDRCGPGILSALR